MKFSSLFYSKVQSLREREEQHRFRSYIVDNYYQREYKNMCARNSVGFWSHGSISVWKEAIDGLQFISVIP